MNRNVFECDEEQDDRRQYAKTVEALEAHAKKSMKYAEDVAPLFAKDMSFPKIELPNNPSANNRTATKAEELIYVEELKEYVKRSRSLKGNLAAMHAVIWGQCSEAMKAKVKSMENFKMKAKENDCFRLLKEVKAVTLQFDQKPNIFISLLDARTSF